MPEEEVTYTREEVIEAMALRGLGDEHQMMVLDGLKQVAQKKQAEQLWQADWEVATASMAEDYLKSKENFHDNEWRGTLANSSYNVLRYTGTKEGPLTELEGETRTVAAIMYTYTSVLNHQSIDEVVLEQSKVNTGDILFNYRQALNEIHNPVRSEEVFEAFEMELQTLEDLSINANLEYSLVWDAMVATRADALFARLATAGVLPEEDFGINYHLEG